jgi:hypothetical protein
MGEEYWIQTLTRTRAVGRRARTPHPDPLVAAENRHSPVAAENRHPLVAAENLDPLVATD